jgi:hypothetical protein
VYQIWSFSICCGAAVSGKQKMWDQGKDSGWCRS